MRITEAYVKEVLKEASDILDAALPADMYRDCVHIIDNVRLRKGVAWWAQIYKGVGRKQHNYDIEVNYEFYEAVPEANVKQCLLTTLCHELIHTVDGCFNHGEGFKLCAEAVRRYTNNYVCVTRKKQLTDWGGKVEDVPSFRYIVTCNNCGRTWGYMSKPKSYGNEYEYECGECKGSITVRKVNKHIV